MRQLFKIDSKDKIRVFNITTENSDVVRRAGVFNGNLVRTFKTSKPKNIGRSNATTSVQQAVLEMQSEIESKVKEGYVELTGWDLAALGDTGIREQVFLREVKVPRPMLAKNYSLKKADYKKGVLVSPKLDGMRCLAVVMFDKIELFSKGGLPILTMGHVIKDLERLRDETQFSGIFDGELYVHKNKVQYFEEVMEACKKYRPGISEQVEYHVYDIVHEGTDARSRHELYASLLDNEGPVKALRQVEVFNESQMLELTELYLAQSYEGAMVKNCVSFYRQDYRSFDLLKVKKFIDAEFLIVDIIPMEEKPEFGMVILEMDGKTFPATPKASHEKRREMLVNKQYYIGKMGTASYFELTKYGVPRFAVFKAVREHGK
jgi:DNA ligase-1